MKKTIAIISLVMCLLFSAIPVGAESIFLQMNTASFEKYQTMSADEICAEKKMLPTDQLVSEIKEVEKISEGSSSDYLIAMLVALTEKDTNYSQDKLLHMMQDPDTGAGLNEALVEIYIQDDMDQKSLLNLLDNNDVDINKKKTIVSRAHFSLEELSDIFCFKDEALSIIAMKKIAAKDPNKALQLSLPLLNDISNQSDEKLIAACLGAARYYERKGCSSKSSFEAGREKAVEKLKQIFLESKNDLVQDQAIYAMSRICDYDLFCDLIESNKVDFELKGSVIERNIGKMIEWIEKASCKKDIEIVLTAMRLHPIFEIGESLKKALNTGRINYDAEIVSIAKYAEESGVKGAYKDENTIEYAARIDSKHTGGGSGGAWAVPTAGECKGYALYRDGVLGNINDHAGLMDENNLRCFKPVLHAPGPGDVVEWGWWSDFLGNNTFLGIYHPRTCNMEEETRNSFVLKARELRGTSYTFLKQIYYTVDGHTWVVPENITDLRCDGVVEYTYEWFGYRVGGGDSDWDITRNSSDTRSAHSGTKITPRKQHNNLLSYAGGYDLIQ